MIGSVRFNQPITLAFAPFLLIWSGGLINQLLQVNQQTAQAMGERYAQLDWQQIESGGISAGWWNRNNLGRFHSNFLMLPQILPSSEQTASQYDELNQGLVLGGSIEQYIDAAISIFCNFMQIREAVRDQGLTNNNVTTSVSLGPIFGGACNW